MVQYIFECPLKTGFTVQDLVLKLWCLWAFLDIISKLHNIEVSTSRSVYFGNLETYLTERKTVVFEPILVAIGALGGIYYNGYHTYPGL